MDILFSKILNTEHGTYISGNTEKVSATVSFYKDGSVNVVCHNAAHRVWKKSGRLFSSLEEAVSGYKSDDMRSIILAAWDLALDSQMLAH